MSHNSANEADGYPKLRLALVYYIGMSPRLSYSLK